MTDCILHQTAPTRNALGLSSGIVQALHLDLLALDASRDSNERLNSLVAIEQRLQQLVQHVRFAEEQVAILQNRFAQKRVQAVREVTAYDSARRRLEQTQGTHPPFGEMIGLVDWPAGFTPS